MNVIRQTLGSVRLLVNPVAGYRVRLAETPGEVRAAQVLRYQVFNLELQEGSG